LKNDSCNLLSVSGSPPLDEIAETAEALPSINNLRPRLPTGYFRDNRCTSVNSPPPRLVPLKTSEIIAIAIDMTGDSLLDCLKITLYDLYNKVGDGSPVICDENN